MTATTTPRTDAVVFEGLVIADFARALERELSHCRAAALAEVLAICHRCATVPEVEREVREAMK